MKTFSNGFSLIELMIVVSIIGMLASVALPAYLEYVARSKMSEVLLSLSACRTTVAETLQSSSSMPFGGKLLLYGFDICDQCIRRRLPAPARIPARGILQHLDHASTQIRDALAGETRDRHHRDSQLGFYGFHIEHHAAVAEHVDHV